MKDGLFSMCAAIAKLNATNIITAHASVTSHGAVCGDGPGAKGFIHGTAVKTPQATRDAFNQKFCLIGKALLFGKIERSRLTGLEILDGLGV